MDNASIIRLRQTQAELNAYLLFFTQMMAFYAKNDSVHTLASGAIDTIKSTNRLIGRVIGSGGNYATQREVEQIYANVKYLNAVSDKIEDAVKQDAQLKKVVEKVSKDTGMAPSKFNLTSDMMRDIINSTNTKKTDVSLSSGMLSRIKNFDVDSLMLGGITPTILGPYTSLLVGGAKALKSWPVQGMLGGLGWLGKKGYGLGKRMLGGGGSYSPASYPTMPHISNGEIPTNSKQGIEYAASPLALFFDKIAFKSKWTKDVYKFLKDGDGSGSSGGIGWKLPLALAGAALGAWALSKIPGLKQFAEDVKYTYDLVQESTERNLKQQKSFAKQIEEQREKGILSDDKYAKSLKLNAEYLQQIKDQWKDIGIGLFEETINIAEDSGFIGSMYLGIVDQTKKFVNNLKEVWAIYKIFTKASSEETKAEAANFYEKARARIMTSDIPEEKKQAQLARLDDNYRNSQKSLWSQIMAEEVDKSYPKPQVKSIGEIQRENYLNSLPKSGGFPTEPGRVNIDLGDVKLLVQTSEETTKALQATTVALNKFISEKKKTTEVPSVFNPSPKGITPFLDMLNGKFYNTQFSLNGMT